MRRNFLSEAQKYIAKNRRRRIWKDIVIVLACIVVFCTTYALILPAITVEQQDVNQVVGDAEYQNDTGTADDTGNDKTSRSTEPTLGTGQKDFKQYITSVSVEHKGQGDSSWKDVTGETKVKETDKLRFNIEYTLPGKTLSYESPIIYYELPDAITTVKADSGEVYDDSGKEIGTYTISADGRIEIKFYREYVEKNINGQEINGYVRFESSVSSITHGSDGNIKLPFISGESVDINIEKEVVKTGDITVTKEASSVTNGQVTYTITVSSQKGTATDVILTDEMTKLVYDSGFTVIGKNTETGVEDTNVAVKIIDENGNEQSIQSLSEGSEKFKIKLPQMSKNYEYTITYTAKFNELSNNTIYGNNKVTVKSTDSNNNELSSQAQVDSSFNNEIIKKTGTFNESNSKITWTITINKRGQDISRCKLTDILNNVSLPKDVKVTISPNPTNNSGSLDIDLSEGYTFPEGSNQTYTVTYTTDVNRQLDKVTVENEAKLTSSDGKVESDKVSVDVNGFNPLNKRAESLTVSNDGKTANIKWNVSINTADGEIPAGWVLTEALKNDQYFTADQQTAIQSIFTELNSTYPNTLEWKEYKSVTINGETKSLPTKFEVTFTNKLPKGENINFYYESTGSLGDGSSSINFENSININNKVWSGGQIQYKPIPVVSKYDLKDENTNDTNYNYNEKKDGVLGWGFKVTIPKNAQGQEIVITENLPEGMSLLESEGSEGLKVLINGQTYTIEFSDGSSTLSVGEYNISFTKNDDNTITINIPQGLTTGTNAITEYKFQIYAKIDEGYTWKIKDYSYVGSFKNEVIVKTGDGEEIGKDDQTQTITQKYTENDGVLDKSHKAPVENNEYKNNIIPYSIVVNKDNKDLLPESATITLKDVIKYTHYQTDPFNISLVPESLHVYRYDVNATDKKGTELSSNEFKYTFVPSSVTKSDGNIDETYTLSIEVPDNQPLIVEYKYKVNANISSSRTINNAVSLEGKIDNSYVSKDYLNINIVESSAGANIKGVVIYKVDSSNNAITLPGAEFELYKWDSKQSKYVKVSSGTDEGTFITDSDGKIAMKNLDYNTAYKLVEVIAPDGYFKNTKPYYFCVTNSDVAKYPLCKPNTFKGTQYSSGSLVYISNKINSTKITVNKKWFDADGTDVSGQTRSEITFGLYQKASTIPSDDAENGKVKFSVVIKRGNEGDSEDKYDTLFEYPEELLPEGTEVTLKLTNLHGVWARESEHYSLYVNSEFKNCDSVIDNDLVDEYGNKAGKTFIYTFKLNEDTEITADLKWSPKTDWDFEALVINPPTYDSSTDSEILLDTYTMTVGEYWKNSDEVHHENKENWTFTLDLPKQGTNEDGKTIYYTYYVREQSVQNYITSYENNSGITSGTITINNKLEKNPEYVLPETGRFGGDILFILGGMLLMAGSLVYIYKRKHKRV